MTEFTKIETIIPAGAYFTVSTGVYSDYYVSGIFRALKDIDANVLRSQWLKDHPDNVAGYRFDEIAFLAWVVREGLLEPVPSFEWHLCDYSRASEMRVWDAGDDA